MQYYQSFKDWGVPLCVVQMPFYLLLAGSLQDTGLLGIKIRVMKKYCEDWMIKFKGFSTVVSEDQFLQRFHSEPSTALF
jgi:hypothetical protein